MSPQPIPEPLFGSCAQWSRRLLVAASVPAVAIRKRTVIHPVVQCSSTIATRQEPPRGILEPSLPLIELAHQLAALNFVEDDQRMNYSYALHVLLSIIIFTALLRKRD